MSTEIKPSSGRSDKFNQTRKAELLNKIEGIPDDINAAIFIEAGKSEIESFIYSHNSALRKHLLIIL